MLLFLIRSNENNTKFQLGMRLTKRHAPMPTVVLLFISDFKAESCWRGSLPRFASYGVTIRTIGSYPAGSLHLLGRTEGFEPSTSESQSNVLPLHYVQHQSGASLLVTFSNISVTDTSASSREIK